VAGGVADMTKPAVAGSESPAPRLAGELRLFPRGVFRLFAPEQSDQAVSQGRALIVRQFAGQVMGLNSL